MLIRIKHNNVAFRNNQYATLLVVTPTHYIIRLH